MLLEMLPVPQSKLQTWCRGSRHGAQSSEPDLYTQVRILPGDDAWKNDYYISFAISLNISLPLCSKKEKNQGSFFLIRTQADSLTSSTPEAMTVCIFRSKRRLMKLSAPNPREISL